MRIGCVKYLNARPLINGWPGSVVLDHPSALCRKLADGELDIALVSSFEFLRNPIYKIVDGISIASDGPVYSVVVAYAGEEPPPEIELDPGSETSVALLQYLLGERNASLRKMPIRGDILAPLTSDHGRLLIGDQAIRFRHQFEETYRYWDLGLEWQRLVHLPFVYALWLVRPEVADPAAIAERLRAVRDRNLREIDRLLDQQPEFDPKFCRCYYAENLRFNFGDPEKQGLREFAKVCAELKLIRTAEVDLRLV